VNDGGKGLIWKIDRFAIHDGPGIRTSVYFQGCPLRCPWCSNPEGQSTGKQLLFLESRCYGCELCLDVCPARAIHRGEGELAGVPEIDRSLCDACGVCASLCPTVALSVPAHECSTAELLDLFERDRAIFRKSGGGVTCTGGEPLRQWSFLSVLLSECRRRGLHTVVETCGFAGEEAVAAVLPFVDQLFFDLKHLDGLEHVRLTWRDNSIILRNLRRASAILGEQGGGLVVRYVVVPGINDGDNIVALADLAASLPHIDRVELLPLHAYGSYKYVALGRPYELAGHSAPSADEMEMYRRTVEERGCTCEIGNVSAT
jgi:pyruvate formate lyase activating enzyme